MFFTTKSNARLHPQAKAWGLDGKTDKTEELRHLNDEVDRCRSCYAPIVFRWRYGRKHPYDVVVRGGKVVALGVSHFDTCPDAGTYGSRGLKARADAHTAAVEKWRESCVTSKVHHEIDWKMTVLFDVPPKHAQPVAWKLIERGGPFAGWQPKDIIPHFQKVAVRDRKVVAILMKSAVFNRIHHHLYGFEMSVFSEMSERSPVSVAGYRLEPSCVI